MAIRDATTAYSFRWKGPQYLSFTEEGPSPKTLLEWGSSVAFEVEFADGKENRLE
jgi:hypothetical protein